SRDEVAGSKTLVSIFTLRRVLAAVILLSIFFGARWILRQPVSGARGGRIAHSTSSDTKSSVNPGTASNQTAPPPTSEIGALPVQQPAPGNASRSSGLPELNVDLDDYQALRDSKEEERPGGLDQKSTGERLIPLPAARAHLVLRLPETGAAGNY